MQSKDAPRARRVHDAQIKAQVLAACRVPGASISAVALAHGLNANLVRNWLKGRGLLRAGLASQEQTQTRRANAVQASPATTLQFVPVSVTEPGAALAAYSSAVPAQATGADVLEVELRRGASQVTVRWPAAQAAQCSQWLRELTAAVLATHAGTP